jgi:hypothetical protein
MIGQKLEGILLGATGGRTYFSMRWLFDRKAEEEDDRQRTQTKIGPGNPAVAGGRRYPSVAWLSGGCTGATRPWNLQMPITVSAAGAVSSIEIARELRVPGNDTACEEGSTGRAKFHAPKHIRGS